MPSHSNKTIKKHVADSRQLADRMAQLTETLEGHLDEQFKRETGLDHFPNVFEADVRVRDICMVYSTDPSVDEYVTGAKNLMGASIDDANVILNALDVVGTVVSKIIGSGSVKAGIHSTSARLKSGNHPFAACMAVVQTANAKEWLTQTDFYVSYYAFVIWSPTLSMEAGINGSPLLGPVLSASPADIPDTRSAAEQNYRYTPLEIS